jgi:hypothetical protein
MLKAVVNLNERFSYFRIKNPETDPVKQEYKDTYSTTIIIFRY